MCIRDRNGDYKASGVEAGANKIAIYYSNPEAEKPRSPGVKAPPSNSPLRNLPFKYADPKTSGLTLNTDTGKVFDFDMPGKDLE